MYLKRFAGHELAMYDYLGTHNVLKYQSRSHYSPLKHFTEQALTMELNI